MLSRTRPGHWSEHDFGCWTVLVPRAWWFDGPVGPDPDDGERVIGGMGGIQRYSLADEPVLNVYFRLAPSVQGRGVATHILHEAMDLGAELAPGTGVVIRIRPVNSAARRVAERAGSTTSGCHRVRTTCSCSGLGGRRANAEAG